MSALLRRLAGGSQLLLLVVVMMAMMSPAAAQAPLRAFGPDSIREIAATAGGKPLVVLVWSLDCSYCLPSFEALAQAQKTHGARVVTIATDPIDDPQARRLVAAKLAAGGLRGPAWAFGPWPEARLRHAIDPAWRGELPRSYWFGADGKATAHSGLISADVVAARLGGQPRNATNPGKQEKTQPAAGANPP